MPESEAWSVVLSLQLEIWAVCNNDDFICTSPLTVWQPSPVRKLVQLIKDINFLFCFVFV